MHPGSAQTVVNFHAGNTLTLWGFTGSANNLDWQGHQSANGYTGATLRTELAGKASAVTLAGFTPREIHSQLAVSTGVSNGTSYLRLTNLG